jgi:hypothetical protein
LGASGSRTAWRRATGLGVLAALAAGLVWLPGAAAAADPVTVGYRDHSYAGTTAPTAEKPQSKVWFTDGTWWGVLFQTTNPSPPTGNFYIHRFDAATQSWVNTGTLVDTRSDVHIDALFGGTSLYTVSSSSSPNPARDRGVKVRGFDYNPATKTYSPMSGFAAAGTVIADGQVLTVSIDKDSTGTLWTTFVLNGLVMVSHSDGAPATWVTPYVLPVGAAATVLPEPEGDEASLVAFDGNKIGLMFSNQAVLDPSTEPTHMYWAVHNDGDSDQTWTLTTAYSGIRAADDHINLKALPAGDAAGRVVAAVKTSRTGGSDPLNHLLVLKGSSWSSKVFGRVSDDHTRGIVDVDIQNRKVFFFAASPCCSGGTVYYKQSSLDSISFSSGKGSAFIQSASDTNISNPSSSKQLLDNTTGLLVIAGDDVTDRYLHNLVSLVPPTVPGPPLNVTATPGNASANVSWAAPASNGNSPITGYRVTMTPGNTITDVGATPTSLAVNGLTNGVTYTFTVQAVNAIGTGAASAPSTPVMPAANTTGGFVLDGYGGLHPFAVGNNAKPPVTWGGPYWRGWDIARGVALLPSGTGGYVVDGYGGLHPFAVGYNPKPPAARGGPYWRGWDIARGVTLLPNGTGGYVVDGYGGLHPFAIGTNPMPPAASGTPYWPGWDIASGLATRLAGGGYVLDGYGGLHGFKIGSGQTPPAPSGNLYIPGWNIFRGVSTLLNGAGGYVLDGYGGLHSFKIGNGPTPAAAVGGPRWNGWDIARDVALRS